MKEEFATDRLIQYAKYKGFSISSFEKSLDKAPSYLRNTKDITTGVLQKLMSVYPELSIDWLITGKGEMLNNTQQVPNAYVGGGGINANYQGNFSQPIHTEIGNTKDLKTSGRNSEIEMEFFRLREENARLLIQLEFKDKLIEEKDKIIEEKGRFIEMILTKS